MRRISIAARRRHSPWGTNPIGSKICKMSIRSACGTSIISSPFVSVSSTDARYQRASASSARTTIEAQHQCLSMSTSTIASASCWVKDVWRTKHLSPPNPILESLPSAEEVLDGLQPSKVDHRQPNISSLPIFSILQPHHLEKAAEEISRQHDVELAQLEVRWTSVTYDESESESEDPSTRANSSTKPSSLSSLLLDLDRLTAPVAQLREVSDLYETLASTPDMIEAWTKASESVDSTTTKNFVENLYRSRIVYRALATAIAEPTARVTKNPSFLIPFLKRGTHIEAEAEGTQQIQKELSVLNDRLDNVISYDHASKAMRLQCMSDMYNCIGLSRLQAESVLATQAGASEQNGNSVLELARLQHNHMVESPQKELIESLFPEIASSLKPFLPKKAKLDLDGVGAFLEGKSELGNSINSGTADSARASLKAKFEFKQRICLHGVLEGFIDFCNQILGIVIVEDTEANNGEAGWSKNVSLLHLYEKLEDIEDDTNNKGDYLGTIYFDPFADSYWRTEDAKDLVSTRLFSQRTTGQTTAPVAIVALKIMPIWDDTPVPMTWKDTRDLLFQMGNAIQLVLDQSRQRRNYLKNDYKAIESAPIDTSDFLAHVS